MATRRNNDPSLSAAIPQGAEGAAAATTQPKRPSRRRSGAAAPSITADARRAMIAEAAYLRAERRGFMPGFEEDDWLGAEKEVDALLSAKHSGEQ